MGPLEIWVFEKWNISCEISFGHGQDVVFDLFCDGNKKIVDCSLWSGLVKTNY